MLPNPLLAPASTGPLSDGLSLATLA